MTGVPKFHSKCARLDRLFDDIINQDDLEKLPDDIVAWTEAVRFLKGEPFTFDDRDYLLPIYRDESQELGVSKGRQTEFTEYGANWLLGKLSQHAGTIGLYMAARGSQTSKFSNIRIKKWAIAASPILSKIAPLKNHTATQLTFTNTSTLFFHSAWEGFEEARSIPADFGVADEVQSTNFEELDVMRESQSHSKFKQLRLLGTGSAAGSAWNNYIKNGKMFKWDGKAWVAKNPAGKYPTYLVPQTIVPWISPEEIEAKREKMSYFRFMTEVMGEFPEGQAKPITEQMMLECMDKSLSFQLPEEIERSKGLLVDGTDWGGGEHAFTIWWLMQEVNGVFYLRYAEKITEPDVAKQAKIIEARRNAYLPDRGVMDAGGGTFQVQQLEKIFGHGLTKAMYMQRPQDPYELKDVWNKNLIQVDRTFSLETLVDIIKAKRLVIPAEDWEKVEWIIDHFTAEETKTVTLRAGGTHTRFFHDDANPDDAFQAFNYAKLAHYLETRKKSKAGSFCSWEDEINGNCISRY